MFHTSTYRYFLYYRYHICITWYSLIVIDSFHRVSSSFQNLQPLWDQDLVRIFWLFSKQEIFIIYTPSFLEGWMKKSLVYCCCLPIWIMCAANSGILYQKRFSWVKTYWMPDNPRWCIVPRRHTFPKYLVGHISRNAILHVE